MIVLYFYVPYESSKIPKRILQKVWRKRSEYNWWNCYYKKERDTSRNIYYIPRWNKKHTGGCSVIDTYVMSTTNNKVFDLLVLYCYETLWQIKK